MLLEEKIEKIKKIATYKNLSKYGPISTIQKSLYY